MLQKYKNSSALVAQMMSSYDDSDSNNESQTCDKILELLKLRTQHRCGIRRLYGNNSPAARRSLNVQKIFQKDFANVKDRSLHEEDENDVAMRCENEIQETLLATPTTRATLQKKSMVCSTPMTRDLANQFVSSLSPVKHTLGQSVSKSLGDGISNQNDTFQQKKNISNENLQDCIKWQPKVLIKDLKSSKTRYNKRQLKIKPVELELLPSPRITGTNTTVSKPNSTNQLILKSPAASISSSTTLSEMNQQNPRLPTKQLLPKPGLELSSAFKYQNSEASPKSSAVNRNIINRNLGSPTTETTKSLSLSSKQTTKYINPEANQILRDWPSTSEAEVIPETQEEYDEIGYRTLVPATQQGAMHIDHDSSLTSRSNSSSIVNQSKANTQEISRSRKPSNKSKKKISDTYLGFLNLEKSLKRKSSRLGTKRKLYSSEQELQKLLEPRDSDSDSRTRRSSNINKPTQEKIQLSSVFKVPNTPRRTTKTTRTKNNDPLNTTEIGVIAENIRILNKSRTNVVPNQTVQIEHITKEKSQNPIAKQKGKVSNLSKNVMVENNMAEQGTGIRRSNRVKHEPMTFWKVHKEPIIDYNNKFYKRMEILKSPKSRSTSKKNKVQLSINTEIHEPESIKVQEVKAPLRTSKKRNKIQRYPVPEIGEPSLNKYIEPDLNNVQNVVQQATVEKNLTVQITQIGELQKLSPTPRPFTSIQSTTRERDILDSALQITTESEDQAKAHTRFVKKFGVVCTPIEVVAQNHVQLEGGKDFMVIDNLLFQEFSDVPGLEVAFVPNTNEMFGFMKLHPYVHKRESRTSRKYFLNLMLITDSSIMIKINQKSMELLLGDIDTIQLPPDSCYELTNNSTKPAVLMLVRTNANR